MSGEPVRWGPGWCSCHGDIHKHFAARAREERARSLRRTLIVGAGLAFCLAAALSFCVPIL